MTEFLMFKSRYTTEVSDTVLEWTDEHLKWLLTLPLVLFLAMLIVYPLAKVIEMSLYSYYPWGREFIGLGNYISVLQDDSFFKSVFTTLLYAGISITAQFIIGFGVALALNRRIRFRGGLQTIIMIPMIISGTVIGLIWRLMYSPEGILNYAMSTGFGTTVPWISSPDFALLSVIIADIWNWTPLVVLVIFAGLQSIPDHVKEAAILDGASRKQRFMHITLPYLKQLIVLLLIVRFIDAIREFSKIFILTRGGPGNATNVISMEIYRNVFRFGNFGEGSATGVYLLLFSVFISIIFIKVTDTDI